MAAILALAAHRRAVVAAPPTSRAHALHLRPTLSISVPRLVFLPANSIMGMRDNAEVNQLQTARPSAMTDFP